MTLADKITSIRLILAPVFFIFYLHPGMNYALFEGVWFVVILWVLFLIIESSDLLDGIAARSRKEVSDFGKLYDPFADTLVRITYFLCFILSGMLPVFPFLVIIFREFGILFLRILMMRKGVAMGARRGGKIKAVAYMLTGVACLLSVTMETLGIGDMVFPFQQAALILFVISMTIAVASFVDYFLVYQKTGSR